MQRCLMLGCGHKTPKRFLMPDLGSKKDVLDWTTLDINPDCNPDVLFDLDAIERGDKLPFPDKHFDEIHAYEVMEHYGHMGDYVGFFTGMNELWRILVPGGNLFGTCPGTLSVWAWGDPGHRRVISSETLGYLDRRTYADLGKNSASDYRRLIDPCWWISSYEEVKETHIHFALMKEPDRMVL